MVRAGAVEMTGKSTQTSSEFDVIVVGSGMSGGIAAKEFAEKGYKVLVVERGKPTRPGTDYLGEGKAPWDMTFRDRISPKDIEEQFSVQKHCYALRESTRHFFVNDAKNPYQTADGKPFYWIRGDQVGGRSLMWGRQVYRWSDLDFAANKNDGHGNDWPIRYADLAPWYDKVERFIGVSGSRENIPHLPDGVFQPAMELTCVEKDIKAKIESAFPDRKIIPGRAAHLTEPTEEQRSLGRGNCQFRSECERGCSYGAYYSSVSGALPAAERTGNLTIVTDKAVERLEYDPQTKRVTGVTTIDRGTLARNRYSGRLIFLCASTLGSIQILQNSRGETNPQGLANSSGVLGRYLMDHHYMIGASGKVPGSEDKYMAGRRPNGIYVPRFRNVKGQETDFLRGYGFQGGASRSSWTRALQGDGFGESLKQELQQPGHWHMRLGGFGEMLPRASNRVTLHDSLTDEFGMPQLNLDVTMSDNEHLMRKDIVKTAEEMLLAAGCVEIKSFNGDPVPGHCIHEMGGARMGNDPSDSVLNKFNQSHDIANLFVTDGSAMASSACQNPSLTYMALTARAVDHADQLMKEGAV